QICPVGALTAEPYRFKARPWDLESVESTCRDCSVGCRIVIQSSRDRVLRNIGVDSDPVNWSWLCDKGRFGFEAVDSEDRLTNPLVKQGGSFVETRWTDALNQAAKAIKAGLDRNGPSGFAVIGGAHLTNESAYAWAKLAKGVVGSDNVDAQIGDGLDAVGLAGLRRATIDEACAKGGTILVLGTDLKDELPVLFLRVRDAVKRRGARIVELSPRETSLTPLALHSLRSVPGAVDVLVDEILSGKGDNAAVRDALSAGPLTVIVGRPSVGESGASALSAAVKVLEAFPEAKALSALRRGNVHGAIDVGLAPGLLPGRVLLADDGGHFAEAWGKVPAESGMDTAGILSAAANGAIDTLVLLGADPLADFPDRELARRGVAGARTVIAVETFANDSTASADIVFPAAGPAEVGGSTTNLEGRVTVLRQKVTPPGTARPDWQVAAELAFLLGDDLGFDDVESIWKELSTLSSLHEGLTVTDLLAEPDGVVADRRKQSAEAPAEPADEAEVPQAAEATEAADEADTATSETGEDDAVVTENLAASLPPMVGPTGPVDYTAPPVDAYSLRLVTARRLYDRATITSKSPSLANLGGSSVARVNPSDLERLGLGDGDTVALTSSKGSLTTPVTTDADVPAGTVVVTWNQGDPSPNVLIDSGAAVTEVRLESPS
ncbi:MAG: molybdopterin-dependent oxidoreductase, partial [Acidimicrobiales bacterium]|nr:molybdopterin-dependent oxidoreductase [Acidimicrobiales bacterium]